MPPRIYVPLPLHATQELALPAGPARHLQVLRLQPGDAIVVFDGRGGEWSATVARMGRHEVRVAVHDHDAIEREMVRSVTLALGMPANERMDALVEKCTELGAARLQPLTTERSVLRLAGERAERKQLHWHQVAVAACEQCGRNRLPQVEPVRNLTAWLAVLPEAPAGGRWLLSVAGGAPLAGVIARAPAGDVLILSGPEGGFSDAEAGLARRAGFEPVTLGPRILRADTAPLAALAALVASERPD